MVFRFNKLQRAFFYCGFVIAALIIGRFLYANSNNDTASNPVQPIVLRGPLYKDKERTAHLRHLLNMSNFNYTLLPATIHRSTLGLLLIHSDATHMGLRAIHRKAMPSVRLDSLNIRRIFVIATPSPNVKHITQADIEAEQAEHGDLLQGNFVDTFRKLVYKHTMALRWATTQEQNGIENYVKFIVKADDDTAFDVSQLRNYLGELANSEHLESNAFIAGNVVSGFFVKDRNAINKWYASRRDRKLRAMPQFVQGSLYVTNVRTAERLVARAQLERDDILWMDDMWLTGLLRVALNVPMVRLNRWYAPRVSYMRCCVDDMPRLNLRCPYMVGPNANGELIADYAGLMEWCLVNTHKCRNRTKELTVRATCGGSRASEDSL